MLFFGFSLEEEYDMRALQLELDLSSIESSDILEIFNIFNGNVQETKLSNLNEYVIAMHIEFFDNTKFEIFENNKDFKNNYINQILIADDAEIDARAPSQKFAFVH